MTLKYNGITTLGEIRAAGPLGSGTDDNEGWALLLRNLGESHASPSLKREVTVLEILNSNGLDDAIWCLRCCPSLERLSRHFQAWRDEQTEHLFEAAYPNDPRIRDQIAMLRDDNVTPEQRTAARAATVAAAGAAYCVAWAAAGDTERARAVAKAASLAAARVAARAASRATQETQLIAMVKELQ